MQYRQQTPQGDKWVTVVQDAGLWFGGVDPAQNLLLSVQKFEPRETDFRAGLPNLPKSARFWQISFDEISQHILDYSEDAVIDQPIEAIFSWPVRGNPFFRKYNGFDLPLDYNGCYSNFVDHNHNGVYEPNLGEYPYYPGPGGGYGPYFADQITAFFFHTDSFTLEFPNPGFPVIGIGYAFTFKCPASPLFENSIFFSWNWKITNFERTDSCQVGLYLNPDIGNPNDDYHGSDWNTYFVYNSDSLYDAGLETPPPIFSLKIIQNPLDNSGNYVSPPRVMPMTKPYANDASILLPMTFPKLPHEFFRYLTGAWRDGRPLSIGGNGYNFNAETTTMAYPGNPFEPGLWTEVNAQNPGGDRRALLSWDYQKSLPGSMQHLSYALTVHPNEGNSISNLKKFNNTFFELSKMRNLMDGLGTNLGLDSSCATRPWPRFNQFIVRPYPNPVSDILNIQTEGGKPTLMRLYDMHQRIVEEIQPWDDSWWRWSNSTQLPVRHLPSGVYFLEVGSGESIHTIVQKIIVLH